jgi:glycosyltransferase involved in cell wall biosynthesis
MNDPLVSVVIATCNGERFLGDALRSLVAQEAVPFEAILVDDGSTDDTPKIAGSFPGIRYVYQENQGPSAARNAGVALARGEFLTFLDDDDLMPPQRLAVQVRYLREHPDVGAVLGRQEWLDQPVTERRDPVFGDPGGVPMCAVMLRREHFARIGGFDTSFRVSEDRDLLIRLRAAGVKIAVIPEIVLLRRFHGGNATAPANRPRVDPLLRALKNKLERERAKGGRAAGGGRQ